jgi:hypothetical protein
MKRLKSGAFNRRELLSVLQFESRSRYVSASCAFVCCQRGHLLFSATETLHRLNAQNAPA